jgi:hypothetical protein
MSSSWRLGADGSAIRSEGRTGLLINLVKQYPDTVQRLATI